MNYEELKYFSSILYSTNIINKKVDLWNMF